MSTRGIQFLDVTKLPSESESFAWFLAGARYRAGAAAWLHDDAPALAAAVCTSARTARRCRLQAIRNGLLQPAEQDRLQLDLARWAERVESARAAGLATVRVHADLLRDPDLTLLDRRVLSWMRTRGRGRTTEQGLFAPNTVLIAKELGIDESSLRRRMKHLGQRLEQSWRTCRDGRSRRTYWVRDPDRVLAGQNARTPENQPPGPECTVDPARLHAPKLASLPGHLRTDSGQNARTPENRTGEPPPQKTPVDSTVKPEPGAAGSLFGVSQLEPRVSIPLSMRSEDGRKAFVADVRPAKDKVCELLQRVRFAEGHPDRRLRVAEE